MSNFNLFRFLFLVTILIAIVYIAITFTGLPKTLSKNFTLSRLTAAFLSLCLVLVLRYAIAGGFKINPLNVIEGLTIGIPTIIFRMGIQGIVDHVFYDLGLIIWIKNIWHGPDNSGKMTIGSISSSSYDEKKKPGSYLYLTADSDNGGEGPSNYQSNNSNNEEGPDNQNNDTLNENISDKVGTQSNNNHSISDNDADPSNQVAAPLNQMAAPFNNDSDNDSGFKSNNTSEDASAYSSINSVHTNNTADEPRTREELIALTRSLQDRALGYEAEAIGMGRQTDNFARGVRAYDKDPKSCTPNELRTAKWVENTVGDDLTKEELLRHYRHSSSYRDRAVAATNIARNKANASIVRHELTSDGLITLRGYEPQNPTFDPETYSDSNPNSPISLSESSTSNPKSNEGSNSNDSKGLDKGKGVDTYDDVLKRKREDSDDEGANNKRFKDISLDK
jgi:hypothetical protein